MAEEKKYDARETAIAVLKKAEELWKNHALSKAQSKHDEKLEKTYEGFKAVEESARKGGAKDPAAVAAAIGRAKYGKKAFQEAAAHGHKMKKDGESLGSIIGYPGAPTIAKAQMPWKKPEAEAEQHAEGKGPKGEMHPKEKEEMIPEGIRDQKAPDKNPKEEAEGNNPLAGTTPTQVGQDGKNVPGFDEMKGHLKLAKFIGYMHGKRSSRERV